MNLLDPMWVRLCFHEYDINPFQIMDEDEGWVKTVMNIISGIKYILLNRELMVIKLCDIFNIHTKYLYMYKENIILICMFFFLFMKGKYNYSYFPSVHLVSLRAIIFEIIIFS